MKMKLNTKKEAMLALWIAVLLVIAALHFGKASAVLFPLKVSLNVIGVDTSPPLINITKPSPTSSRNITITGTYSEDSIIANITVEVNSSYTVSASINTGAKTWSAPINLTEGWNRFYVLAYDASGNSVNATSSSQGASILSDTTSPAINLTAPQNSSSVANNSLITFRISDLYLADVFYTINNGATTSFNSIYELKAGSSSWVDGANYIIVNATDSVNNVERKNFTFSYSNSYSVVLNASITTARAEINSTNSTISGLQDSTALAAKIDTFAAEISVGEYNDTIQTLNVVGNLTNAVSSIETLLQEILAANSSSGDNATKTAAINAKLEQISIIKNTTVSSVEVNLFNPNLTVSVENSTTSNVTGTLLAAVSGLSSSDQQSFVAASDVLQNKTTVINNVQSLTKVFLNGRTENITLFEKNITISESQSGQFYVNEFIGKNITGNNDLNASSDVTNRITQAMTIVAEDPIVRWTFSDTAGAVVKYTIDKNIPSEKIDLSKTVLTTVPAASSSASSSAASSAQQGSKAAGGGGSALGDAKLAVSKETLKVVLKQTEKKTEVISIKNIGTAASDVRIGLEKLKNFISPESWDALGLPIRLLPGEEKIVEIVFKAAESIVPNIYPFEIILSTIFGEKKISAIIEVESAKPLFDIDAEVLPNYKEIFPGDKLLIEVSIFNLKGFGRIDVNVDYSIMDFQGNAVASGHETLAVETEVRFIREFIIPSDLRQGDYIVSAKVSFGEFVGTSSDTFSVKAKTIKFENLGFKTDTLNLLLAVILVLFVVFVVLIYEYGISSKSFKHGDAKDRESLKNLKRKLRSIEKAYYSGAVKKETYQKLKQEIEGKLRNKEE